MLDFFSWWYGQGWTNVVTGTKRRLGNLTETFSVGLLLRTLFSPWRRIITYPGAGLGAHIRAFGDNLVSRFIGLLIRITVLIAAGLSLFGLLLVSGVLLLAWPLLPPVSVALLVKGLLP